MASVHGEPDAEVEEPDWTRWATASDGAVLLAPVLPDRPAVVVPEVPFHLPPGARARVYVRIPLWARLALADGPDVTLVEIPSIVMSDTWWGDFVSGELAFWLPTQARRTLSDDVFEPHLVICPLELRNDSDDVLPVERIAVRVAHMTIFQDENGLWANEMRVRYEKDAEGSRIEMGVGPPGEAVDATPIAPPRRRPERGFRALTFGRLLQAANL